MKGEKHEKKKAQENIDEIKKTNRILNKNGTGGVSYVVSMA